MNSNDFERELRRQELRKIPDEWRGQILGNAIAVTEAPGTDSRELTFAATVGKWWRQLLWPCPQAWAGLAAVWIMIAVLNSGDRQSADFAHHEPTQRSAELVLALREQRRLLAEFTEAPAPAEKPKSFAPRPRSERRLESVSV